MSDRVQLGSLVKLSTESAKDPAAVGLTRSVGLDHIDSDDLRLRRWSDIGNGADFTRVFRAGDVLFGKRRSYQRKVALADFDGVCSGDILVVRSSDPRLDGLYLAYLLASPLFIGHAISSSAGSLSPRIRPRDLERFEFDLPSLDEQHRVVEVMRGVDREVEAAGKVLQAAVTAGASMVAPAAGTPTALGEALSLITAGTTPAGRGMSFEESGVRFVKTESIVSGRVVPALCSWISQDTHGALRRSQIQAGDVLLSIAGTVGRVAIATEDLLPANCNQAIAILRPDPSLDANYLAAWLGTRDAQEQMSRLKAATTIFNLSMTLIKQLKIAVPDLQSQRAFAERAAIHSEMVASAQAAVESSYSLRTSLLQELIG